MSIPIAVAYGDGIGPEIMDAVLRILAASGAPLELHIVEIGEKVYKRGHPTGIEASTWEILRRTQAFLKAPITTPQGGGFKSLNVTIRTTLGLYANIRPCTAYAPFVKTKHPGMDVTIVRENEEDLYAGIEYRLSPNVARSLKLISRAGSEKIVRYAFEYARHFGRKKVSCFTKDNIMKFTDGLFHKVFDEIAPQYPDIAHEHWIVDIGAAKLADTPEVFDVVVLPNLYGDILSDVAAQISGSVGLAGSSNIGESGAMFEAIHGSAPRRAGQDLANPSGLLLAAVQMLLHIGQESYATTIHNAWLRTLEEGIHTYDIFTEKTSRTKVGTGAFAQAVIERLGILPEKLKAVSYAKHRKVVTAATKSSSTSEARTLVGVDLFFYDPIAAQPFCKKLCSLETKELKLQMISNRGTRIWPEGHSETFCIEEWRCRFQRQDGAKISFDAIVQLEQTLTAAGCDIIATENLYTFDGNPGFSSAQG